MKEEKIPKAVVLEFPDGTKPKKKKWIFKSKTHFFAMLGAIAAFFPTFETWASENPKLILLGIYGVNLLLRRITKDEVYLFPKAGDIKGILPIIAVFFLISCSPLAEFRSDEKQLEQSLKGEVHTKLSLALAKASK